ncbi:MAG TPA: vitamin B12 dependent-methionine synthase activation domain-containing protein [Usitatibacter sp.]
MPARIDSLVDAATAVYLDLAEPRAIVAEIPAGEFADIYRGEGLNSHETPLEAIYPKAAHLALVAATVGARVTTRVRELFLRHDLAIGCMLDSIASAGTDRLADLLGLQYVTMVPGSAADWRALTYSPGYCGWHVSGQRALFGFLRPEEIGITLNPSYLMQPLKSISGVIVVGSRHIHRFHPTYSFCERCQEKQCRDRMASVSRC